MAARRLKWSRGAVVSVPLQDGSLCHAQMLNEPEYAFFDTRSGENPTPEAVVASPVLFRLWVMRRAHSRGRWPKIGTADVPEILTSEMERFKVDAITSRVSIYMSGVETRATADQCQGLERAAVWEPEHVEERLLDHNMGRPNRWAESLSLTGQ